MCGRRGARRSRHPRARRRRGGSRPCSSAARCHASSAPGRPVRAARGRGRAGSSRGRGCGRSGARRPRRYTVRSTISRAALAGSSRRATTSSSMRWKSASSWRRASRARRRRAVARARTSARRLRRRRSLRVPSASIQARWSSSLPIRASTPSPVIASVLTIGPASRAAGRARGRRGSRGPSCRPAGGRPC